MAQSIPEEVLIAYRRMTLEDMSGVGLFTFCKDVLGFDKMREEVHLPLCKFLCSKPRADLMALVKMSRGTYKTTICTIGFPLWQLMREKWIVSSSAPGEKADGKDIGIIITSETLSNSEGFLRLIRNQLEANDKFKMYYGDWHRKDEAGWTTRFIILKGAMVTESIDTAGVDNSRASRHPHLRINDDMQTEKSNTPTQIQAVRDTYIASQQLFHPDRTGELNVGTPYYTSDLISAQTKGDFGKMDIFARSALIDSEGNPTTKYEWDHEREQIVLPEGISCWFPEVLPLEFLSEKRKKLGPYVFSSQYLCEPVAAGDQIFDWEQWIAPQMYEELPSNKAYNRYLFIDWGGEKRGNHYTAMIVVYVDSDMHFWIEDGDFGNWLPNVAVNKVFEFIRKHGIQLVGVERNTFQTLYAYTIRELREKEGMGFFLKELIPHREHKAERIKSLIPIAEQKRLHVRKFIGEHQPGELGKFTQAFKMQYEQFPNGEFDDIPDATGYITYTEGGKSLIAKPAQAGEAVPKTLPDPHTLLKQWYEEKERKELAAGPRHGSVAVAGLGFGGGW